MSKEDDAIIQAAKAAHEAMRRSHALDGTSIPHWDEDDTRDFWIEVTRAAIAAYLAELEAAGWAVVRKEAAKPALFAGMDAMARPGMEPVEDDMQRGWGAVIAASPKPPGLGD